MDKKTRTASHDFVSPYLLKPLRSLSEAMKDRGEGASLPPGDANANNGLGQTVSLAAFRQKPAATPSESRGGATVIWLSSWTARAGQTNRPDP